MSNSVEDGKKEKKVEELNPSNKLLSDIVSFRSYAKYLTHLGRRESLSETINRNMVMNLNKFPKFSSDIIKAFKFIHELKVMPSMRAMQFGGEAILKNEVRSYNCSYAPIEDTKIFSEALFLLLSGVGFGFSVQKRHIGKLPKIKRPSETVRYIIHDSIQGWADSLNTLMESYFFKKIKPDFDFSLIRAKGSYLVTTGAKAPGPEPLKIMLKLVEERLENAVGRQLTPIEVHDMICIISDAVLAGGIRRAALISLFDRNDMDMLKCKQGNWWDKHPYRARANNSAVLPRDKTTREEFDFIYKMCQESGSGEPGIYWTNNEDMGTNPCCFSGETTLKTENGDETFASLVGKTFNAYNKDGILVPAKVWETGKKQTVVLTMSNGEEICCTHDHKFLSFCGAEVKAEDSFGAMIKHIEFNNIAVIGIKDGGERKVFDFNLDDNTHWGVVGSGFIAHNCEIGLNPYQFCNLVTVNQSNITSKKDFLNRVSAATTIGTIQASYTNFEYLRPIWQETTEREALLGVSFTGIADGSGIVTDEWLIEAAELTKEVNAKIAKKLGINHAARITALKPEGSASCVLGSSSGIHARHSRYYIRRVRMNKDDALAVYLKNVIPDLVEDDKFSSSGVVVSIPQESPENSIVRDEETAKSLFDRAMRYNTHWVRNGHRSGDNFHNVSVTISIKDHEWDEIKELMWDNRDLYNGVSLLPFSDHTYVQAPFEDCSKEEFERLNMLVKGIDLTQVIEHEDKTERAEQVACAGGLCTLEI